MSASLSLALELSKTEPAFVESYILVGGIDSEHIKMFTPGSNKECMTDKVGIWGRIHG